MRMAIVDVETTGGSATFHRVIEVGVVVVEDGKEIKRFESLVYPRGPIPEFISRITGITTDDVTGAPLFEEIAHELHDLLEGSVFVAHNARFDYAFMKNEFKRAGISFSADCLCTVRLSRSLFPEQTHHNLDTIIDRWEITVARRHRALDDALVLFEFLKKLEIEIGQERYDAALGITRKERSLPPLLPREALQNLPESAGVYRFYGPEGTLLYVGKSINIRDRARSHFSGDHQTSKELTMCQQVARIETEKTAGELGALLLEARQIKSELPLYNRVSRRVQKLSVLRLAASAKDEYYRVSFEYLDQVTPELFPEILGLFRSKGQALETARTMADEQGLCPKLLGLETGSGPCFSSKIGKCRGACVGSDPEREYNARLMNAFSTRRLREWPFSSGVVIEEKADDHFRDLFYVDQWVLRRAIFVREDDVDATWSGELFDYDMYKILAKFLLAPRNRRKIRLMREETFTKQFGL